MTEKQPVIAVVGPTASGKTALSIGLAKALSGEIISADSMQIYKGLEIASAAPTDAEMAEVPHHLVRFIEPTHRFSVAEYVNKASAAIAETADAGHLPIVVGGTGLYVDSLLSGIRFKDEDDPSVRRRLEAEADLYGMEHMLERLRLVDPKSAARLHINDRKRIIRALEIYEIHGMTVDEQNELSRINGSPYRVLWIGINYKDRETLYKRIEKRIDLMIENGLTDEARAAYEVSGKTAVQAIGHKEFFLFFEGKETLEQAVSRLKTETRHYAKRQITWFKRNGDINWIYADETDDVLSATLSLARENGY